MNDTFALEELKAKVNYAIQQLRQEDRLLFCNDASERSITHKLAEYLQQIFHEYHVDCEYNRYKKDPKQLQTENTIGKHFVFPDIVIHERGKQSRNLLVIEAKRRQRRDNLVPENDRIKLQKFTTINGAYKYDYGLFIAFNRLKEPKLIWFQDGAEL